jgi:hypothetical protein
MTPVISDLVNPIAGDGGYNWRAKFRMLTRPVLQDQAPIAEIQRNRT